jgi:hypothetical protein
MALVTPLLCVLLLALIDLGWLAWVYVSVHTASRNACINAMRNNADCRNPVGESVFSASQVRTMVIDSATSAGLTTSEVTVTFRSSDTSPSTTWSTVEVIVNHTHTFLVPALWASSTSVPVYTRLKSIWVHVPAS